MYIMENISVKDKRLSQLYLMLLFQGVQNGYVRSTGMCIAPGMKR
jgi:hypothetical protein